jgi:hypothetical protein
MGICASLLAAAVLGWVTVRLLSPLVRLRDTLLSLRASGKRFTPCRCSSATRSAS